MTVTLMLISLVLPLSADGSAPTTEDLITKLDAYTSQIRTFQVTYVANSDSEVNSGKKGTMIQLQLQPPKWRMLVRRLDLSEDDPNYEGEYIRANGRSVRISQRLRRVVDEPISLSDFGGELYIHAIGLRTYSTTNSTFADLCKTEKHVRYEGRVTIGGVACEVLTVGPPITEIPASEEYSNDARVRISMAPEFGYAPVRWEYLVPSKRYAMRFTNEDFRRTPNGGSEDDVWVPWEVVNEIFVDDQLKLRQTMTLKDVSVNRLLTASTFHAGPRPGFEYIRDGERIRQSHEEIRRRVALPKLTKEEFAAAHKGVFDDKQAVPDEYLVRQSPGSWWSWLLVCMIALSLVFAIGGYLLYRRKSR
ncbi:hypothetical protein Pan216_50030 [Planctomycetes bacterium Pan216]|uniref:DUF1583 domain-containing protein n=1 Tax=Kolteria novifilia TaxID=2527975 RepID=A0A518BAV3_9BACT|nr:hypothetical protein Pan216_50030 [Planctomycetes bacterium Pan216]